MVKINAKRIEKMLMYRQVLVHVSRVRDPNRTLKAMRECVDSINLLFKGHTPLIKFEVLGDRSAELDNMLSEIQSWHDKCGQPVIPGIIVQYNSMEFRKPERYDYHIW